MLEYVKWACEAASGAGTLAFYDIFTDDESYMMNAEVYRSILCAQIHPNAS